MINRSEYFFNHRSIVSTSYSYRGIRVLSCMSSMASLHGRCCTLLQVYHVLPLTTMKPTERQSFLGGREPLRAGTPHLNPLNERLQSFSTGT